MPSEWRRPHVLQGRVSLFLLCSCSVIDCVVYSRSTLHSEKRSYEYLCGKEYTLNRPIESDCSDEQRPGNDDALPVPGFSAKRQSKQQERGEDHRQLSTFHAGIERQQRRDELRTRQADLRQHAGESHSVQEPKTENNHRPPCVQLRRKNIFDGDIDDRKRNERLDHPRRE